jgi:hypothetical protein
MDDFTDVYGEDGEESWADELADGTDIETTVTWSTSYSVIDLKEL